VTRKAPSAPHDTLVPRDTLVVPPDASSGVRGALPGAAAGFPAQTDDQPALRAGALLGPIRVDGRLDEPCWQDAPAISNLIMVEPRVGAVPTLRTEVRVLAGLHALVIGVRCEDDPAHEITSFTKERDGDLEQEDHVLVVLDPLRDGRSGYVFEVNPGGARYDGLVSGGGGDVSSSWDGVWEAGTQRDASGWTLEMRIPVASIGCGSSSRTWGFNVQRRLQRLLEVSRWANPRPDFQITQTSRAGLLTDLPDFDLGWGMSVRPAVISGSHRSRAARHDEDLDVALDATQQLGPSARASLTVNTDFAETEVDARQTNLTRFPLFFPEKRTFFLESADVFEFGSGLDEAVIPFFSRRIGLVAGQAVPIVAGLTTTGRLAGTGFGGLVVHTDEELGLAPETTVGVVRAKQNVLRESWVGGLGTVGDPLGRSGSWLGGADFTYQTSHFRGSKNLLVGLWGLETGREDLSGDRSAAGVTIDYPNDLWNLSLTHRRIGDGFDPSLGFVPRRAVRSYEAGAEFAPRPQALGIHRMFFEFYPSLFTDLHDDWESYEVFVAPVNWRLETGDRFEFNVVPQGEHLVEPFEVADGVSILPGSYHWRRYRLEAGAAAKRRLSGQLTWWFGGFYGGTLDQIQLESSWTPSAVVTFLLSGEEDIGRLPEGQFDQTLLGVKTRLNLSPNLQLNSFVQYDSESRLLGGNTRLRWTFRPVGDLFVVYNHNLSRPENRFQFESSQLLVKLQYAWRR